MNPIRLLGFLMIGIGFVLVAAGMARVIGGTKAALLLLGVVLITGLIVGGIYLAVHGDDY
jgi:hypothetical protein